MLFIRRWLARVMDRRPVVRTSLRYYRKPWWRRNGRAWLLLALLLALIAAIMLLLGQAQALEAKLKLESDEMPLAP